MRELRSLTGLRAVAAGLVFAFHTTSYGVAATPWWHVSSVGFVGVSFFFILSGLVLTWSSPAEVPARPFAVRRAARIYPAHVVVSIAVVALYVHWTPSAEHWWAVALSFLLVQAWWPTTTLNQAGNGVAWSLSCEMAFYLCFPWLHRGLRQLGTARRWVVTAGVAATCAVPAAVSGFTGGWHADLRAYEDPVVRIGEFVVGVTLGLALREGWRPRLAQRHAWGALAVVLLGCAGVGGRSSWPSVHRGLVDSLALAPLAALLAAYAGRDLRGLPSVFASRPVVYLGRVSFAFYLVHQAAVALVFRELSWSGSSVPADLARAVLALLLSLGLAVALHHGVEVPAQRVVVRRVLHRRRPSTVACYPTEAVTVPSAYVPPMPAHLPVLAGRLTA